MQRTKDGKYRIEAATVEKVDVSHIPGLKQFADGNCIGSLDAVSVAARRAKAPTPPRLSFGWSQDGRLREYQRSGVGWVVEHLKKESGCLLADDMGLGKCLQTLTAWNELNQPQMLIVCPASVRDTWRRECDKWQRQQATMVTTGRHAANLDINAHIVVTSYELVAKLPDGYAPTMMVMDEVHNMRGRGAQKSRRLLDFAKGCNYRLGLTGTPMWSRPRDLWMVLRIIFPNYRFGNADEFDFAYCGAHYNAYGGKVAKGVTRADELKYRLEFVMLRRTKAEVLKDLPAMTRTVRWVPGTPAARKLFAAFSSQTVPISTAIEATLDSKLDAAVAAAHEAQKFLLFTWMKRHANELHRRLNDEGTPCVLITGDQTHAARDAAVSEAAAKGWGVVATIDSCNAGVDGLQKVASIGIFHSLDWVPIKMAQAEARLHRMGQEGNVQWVYIAMEGSADCVVMDTVVEKLDQWREVMGRDTTALLRDSLSAESYGDAEKEVLRQMYADMEKNR